MDGGAQCGGSDGESGQRKVAGRADNGARLTKKRESKRVALPVGKMMTGLSPGSDGRIPGIDAPHGALLVPGRFGATLSDSSSTGLTAVGAALL